MRYGLANPCVAVIALTALVSMSCSSAADDDSVPHHASDAGERDAAVLADSGRDSGEVDSGNRAHVAPDAAAMPAVDGGGLSSDAGSLEAGASSDAGGMESGTGGDAGLDSVGSDAAADGAIDSGPAMPSPLLPVDQLAWPHEPTALLPCTPTGLSFSVPTLAHAGRIAIGFSAPLQPSGVLERAQIRVLNADDETDADYEGTLTWTLPSGTEVVEASAVVAGEAEVTLRFAAPGIQRVQASLSDDPRTGFAEVLVYAPQLPIWELSVPAADLQRIIDHPDSDEQIMATLSVDGSQHAALVRLHGGSSRYFPKSSFRFDLLDAANGTWGTHLILRAEFNDKTLLRNWLGLHLFRDGTWLPAPRSQLVHFRVNGEYYGVMNNVERIDGQFLTARGLRSSASLYEADPPFALASPGGNLTPLADPELYRSVYPHHGGSVDYDDLRKLIEQTLVLPALEFEQASKREIMVDDELVYLAMMAALQNADQVRKNFYLYRDSESPASPGWRVLPWDLDLTLGHLWSEQNETLEEEIASDADIFLGEYAPERGDFYNQLTDRMLGVPAYRARFLQMLDHIVAASLTREYAERLISNAICRATPDLLADSKKRADNTEYLARVEEIYAFIAARTQYIHSTTSSH